MRSEAWTPERSYEGLEQNKSAVMHGPRGMWLCTCLDKVGFGSDCPEVINSMSSIACSIPRFRSIINNIVVRPRSLLPKCLSSERACLRAPHYLRVTFCIETHNDSNNSFHLQSPPHLTTIARVCHNRYVDNPLPGSLHILAPSDSTSSTARSLSLTLSTSPTRNIPLPPTSISTTRRQHHTVNLLSGYLQAPYRLQDHQHGSTSRAHQGRPVQHQRLLPVL